MLLYNPYTHGCINYPLDLSNDNISRSYQIMHETTFCPWISSWLVVNLNSGDVVYIPAGQKNTRNIYIITSAYLNKEVAFPYGIYTLRYIDILRENNTEIIQQLLH